jgi:SAM-dependent methyltransferase
MPADPEMLDYYARRAREYDRIYEKPERQADLATLRTALAGAFSGKAVYEVACGTGFWTEVIEPQCSGVFATDHNDEVLVLARARLEGSTKVVFANADAFAPPPAPFPVTAGFAAFWWSHVRRAELRTFLKTFFARLHPGASFIFLDNSYVPGSSTPLCRTDAEGNTFQLRQLTNGERHEVLKNFPDEAEVRAVLADLAAELKWTQLGYYWLIEGRVK